MKALVGMGNVSLLKAIIDQLDVIKFHTRVRIPAGARLYRIPLCLLAIATALYPATSCKFAPAWGLGNLNPVYGIEKDKHHWNRTGQQNNANGSNGL